MGRIVSLRKDVLKPKNILRKSKSLSHTKGLLQKNLTTLFECLFIFESLWSVKYASKACSDVDPGLSSSTFGLV